MLLGIAANETIQWGRRGQRQLLQRDSYLETLLSISGSGSVPEEALVTLRAMVAARIKVMLDLDSCRRVDHLDETAPQPDRDGEVRDTAAGSGSRATAARPGQP